LEETRGFFRFSDCSIMDHRIKGKDLTTTNAVFLLCDVQERFRPSINTFPQLLEVAGRLVDASKILDIPLIVTEQYPKGLGNTVSELNVSHAVVRIEKTLFSMAVPEVTNVLKKLNRSPLHVVLFGLETHVCIQQTALDLLGMGIEVFVVADACVSRSQTDRIFAFERLKQAGCIVTTYESVLLQLIRTKDHPQFKAIQEIIKPLPTDSGLISHKL